MTLSAKTKLVFLSIFVKRNVLIVYTAHLIWCNFHPLPLHICYALMSIWVVTVTGNYEGSQQVICLSALKLWHYYCFLHAWLHIGFQFMSSYSKCHLCTSPPSLHLTCTFPVRPHLFFLHVSFQLWIFAPVYLLTSCCLYLFDFVAFYLSPVPTATLTHCLISILFFHFI